MSPAPETETRRERGAILLISAFALAALLGTAALVVDLSAARNDRSENQVTSDAAAAAGAVALADTGGMAACQAALAYAEANIGTVLAGGSCAAFPVACTAVSPSASTTASAGSVTVTIKHPVADDDPLMGSSAMGAPDLTAGSSDGGRCDRIAVEVAEVRDVFFGGFVATPTQRTAVHSVAMVRTGGENSRMINLLLVNQTSCEVIQMSGGGSSGGIIVRPATDPITGIVHPGSIAADSDGSGCGGHGGVIDVNGSHATVRADGEPGCATELSSGPGHGCGRIEVYADGGPGCTAPACSSSGVVAPDPARQPSRLTRAPIDHRFNCKSSYPVAYGIEPCAEAGSTSAYIDNLVSDIGVHGRPSGFQNYSSIYPCNVGGGPSTVVVVPEGNWYVDCDLRVARTLTFSGGNIVFAGDVSVTANGILTVNAINHQTFNWIEGSPVDHLDHSARAAYVYFRDGTLSKAGGGSIIMRNTMVYLSETSGIEMSGGSGAVSFVAPTKGPFKDLAVWSESSDTQKFAGGASVELEGVFFAPKSTVRYTGNGGQTQVAAQFIADKLDVSGNGALVLAPRFDRSVQFPSPGFGELIR